MLFGYLKLAAALTVVGALSCFGAYHAGRAVGAAQCAAESLRHAMAKAGEDAEAHAAAEDTNTQIAVEDAKAESSNDVVGVKIDAESSKLPNTGECVPASWVRGFNSLK